MHDKNIKIIMNDAKTTHNARRNQPPRSMETDPCLREIPVV